MTDPEEAAESMEARLARLELRIERLLVELAQVRSALGSMLSGDGEARLPEP